jgi:quercetin dioxygenase-like cupin family protein
MSAQDSIEVVASRAGDPLQVLGAEILVKSSGDPRHFFFADHPMPQGYGVPLHVHEAEDEAFFVLEGEITLMSREGERKAGAGSYIFLPRGVAHGFVNASDAPARMLVIASPGGGIEGLFRGLDAAAKRAPLEPVRIGEICAANGVRMLLPPPPAVELPSPAAICSFARPPVHAFLGEGI